jgi:hypothetical protein
MRVFINRKLGKGPPRNRAMRGYVRDAEIFKEHAGDGLL